MTSVSDIRVYVGPQLPRETERRDLEKLFEDYGELKDVQLKSGFAFVEFASSRDAENAIKDVHGKKFFGERINVEFAQVSRRYRDDDHDPYRRGPPTREPIRSNRPTRSGNRVLIDGLSTETSWQDLKDFMREAGQVCFADVPRERDGRGVIEYAQREDMLKAIETLNGKECKGQVITITEDPNPHDEPAFTSRLTGNDRHRDEEATEEASAAIIPPIAEAIAIDQQKILVILDEMIEGMTDETIDEMIDSPPEETMTTTEERLSGIVGAEEAMTDPDLERDAAETTEID
ncbi:Serine/arginine-rich splicing factor 4 [Neolecta irregularis DAH-3]|uniref:Serine/arginine-rich splicing factor 4 n=1 Tax=Neolecta irregularis (strain DAH-3) TaxID=1198029 RepID=A0A1U7LKH1_NEOID|nr:Serine/arginine-rich splicing factor 4 [Neolecta irregularis DAH-3]|eukprot:OLL23021.1 Serine/arginine-rich splicing factor 4 [Neolecta irregularis DAH-3]